MNNPFPSGYDKRYYIYLHFDEISGDVVYVGYGCGARAWLSDVPFRSEEHAQWLKEQENLEEILERQL